MDKVLIFGDDYNVKIAFGAESMMWEGETVEEFLIRIAKKVIPFGDPYYIVDIDSLPTSYVFEEAFKIVNKKIVVDLPKAKKLYIDVILRPKRNDKLRQLDIEEMIANSEKNRAKLTEIWAKKKVLRNLPKTVDLSGINTPEDLEAYLPKELKDGV